ncbi:ABC transporter permease [Anaerorhabdus furcosa]|uniref:Oligopeptide transport system permease protein n=1 Tax=Anaerorhabdus furcosa TaxID=118967 RepID=A0A1T4PRF0_9FIRM|nr:ABC transporter permease [Anaerorhabdus furcosa]SJZ94125.1 oligopeptide transport system permease protein [Anaerorhabdus furcosa]
MSWFKKNKNDIVETNVIEEVEVKKEDFVFEKASVVEAEGLMKKPLTFWKDAFLRLLQNKFAVGSVIVILLMVTMAIVAPMTSKYDLNKAVSKNQTLVTQLPPRIPFVENLGIFDGTLIKETTEARLATDYQPDEYKIIDRYTRDGVDYVKVKEYTYKIKGLENEYFYFGTDQIGRDIWTRLWYGARISLLIGFYAALIDVLIGVVYGGIAGFYGGSRLDDIMMRITEILYGIPSIVILFILFMFLEPGIVPIAIAIALTGWIGVARMVRAQFLRLRDQEFVLAARTLGASPFRLIMKHLIPNVVAQIVVMASFSIPNAIFYEAFLAFIGIGMNVKTPSLGTMIDNALGTTYGAMTYVYQLIIPCVVLSILMLSINLLANGLRDSLDPRMRGN